MARRRRRGLGDGAGPQVTTLADSAFPAWSGLPVGVAVTYAATKILPPMRNVQSDWLYPVPYTLPAVGLGVLMLFTRRFKRAGYGTLAGAAAYYAYAVVANKAQTAEYRRMVALQQRQAVAAKMAPPPGSGIYVRL